MFENMVNKIRNMTCLFLLNTHIDRPEPVQQMPAQPNFTVVMTGKELTPEEKAEQAKKKQKPQVQQTVVNTSDKIGRNDPCPCGSGKKYKNCCGK